MSTTSSPSPLSSTSTTADDAPPALPAHLLEVLTPLYDLLERVAVQTARSITDGTNGTDGADGTDTGGGGGGVGVGVGSDGGGGGGDSIAALPPPLAVKDFAAEVLRVKHAAAAARAQIRGLPDLARSVPEQLAEFRTLTAQRLRAATLRDDLARRAREVREGATGTGKIEMVGNEGGDGDEDVRMRDGDDGLA